ncbi:MAG: 3-isopropylmalate dehydratase small subunit [Gammaproteobacteria bacterium]|nr:3-isopropylmalate dehydratase small subunit [Gammaproteobacteria bacterium]
MEKFHTFNGLVVPLDRANIDTDAIIPKQFLKSIQRSGFGPYAFDEWRYEDQGEPGMDCRQRPLKKDFVLNLPRYQGGEILLTRENFGCGSSREHAPWALRDYGFRVIIAPSFADIFFNNCFKNGILPIVLAADQVDSLFLAVTAAQGYRLNVNLADEVMRDAAGNTYEFSVDPFRKQCLLEGLDDIGLTLQHVAAIKAFELRHQQAAPWLFSHH